MKTATIKFDPNDILYLADKALGVYLSPGVPHGSPDAYLYFLHPETMEARIHSAYHEEFRKRYDRFVESFLAETNVLTIFNSLMGKPFTSSVLLYYKQLIIQDLYFHYNLDFMTSMRRMFFEAMLGKGYEALFAPEQVTTVPVIYTDTVNRNGTFLSSIALKELREVEEFRRNHQSEMSLRLGKRP